MGLKRHIMTFLNLKSKSTMKNNLIIILFLLITSSLYANLDFIKLEDLNLDQSDTESIDEVSNDISLKSVKKTFEYTLKTHLTSIDNVELTPQNMHRFAYYNHENNLYGFVSVGTFSETLNNQTFSYIHYTNLGSFSYSSVYSTSTFMPIIAGVGFFLKRNSYKYNFEFAYQSYHADTNFNLSGILFGVGLKKYFNFLNHFGFHANINLNFGNLSTLNVNDDEYNLDSPHKTNSFSAGIGININ